MTDDDTATAGDAARRDALAQAEALRALLTAHGAGAPAPVPVAGDEDLLARILASGPAGTTDAVARTAAATASATAADTATAAAAATTATAATAATAAAAVTAAERGAGGATAPRPDAGPAPVVPLHRPARRAGRARRWAAVAAGVAAAVAGGTVLALLPPHDPPAAVAAGSPPMLAYPVSPEDLAHGAGEPAGATLRELAAAAAARTEPAPAGDVQHVLSQAWYQSTTVDAEGTTSTVDPVVRETWLSPDGSLVALEWRGQHLADDGLLERVDTAPADASVDRLPPGTVDPDRFTDVSRDPATARAQLLAAAGGEAVGCGPGTTQAAWCLYQAVTAADGYVLPAAFESTLWTVLADEPGVTLAGEVTDRTGRRAVAVAVPGGPDAGSEVVRVVLVDAATGRFSGNEEVTLSAPALDIDEPTVTLFRYQVAADRVAEPGGPAVGAEPAAAPSGLQLDQDGGYLVRELARQVAQRADAGGEPVAGGAVHGGAPAGGLLGGGPAGEQPADRTREHVPAA